MAMVAMIPRMATTIMISTSVKAAALRGTSLLDLLVPSVQKGVKDAASGPILRKAERSAI
jgi:hypothetical protein